MARQGKIARLPAALKAEVNQRLFDGEGAPSILPWLNSLPDAIRVWEKYFQGLACSPQNLSEWRLGGHKDWIRDNERIEKTKELTAFSMRMVKAANGSLSDGLAAIAGGQMMDALETLGNIVVTGGSDDSERDPLDGLTRVVGAIKQLQDGDRKREDSKRKDETLELNRQRHDLSKQQVRLAEEKFRKLTVEKLMEIARQPEFQALLGSREDGGAKMASLHRMLFGEAPKGNGGPA